MARRVSFIVSAKNDGFMKALDQSAKRMDRFGRKLQRQGRAMSTYLTAPTLAAGGAAVKMAADFEGSLSKIEGLVGLARNEVQGMRGDVLNLAGQTAQAPQELADALFFVTSAGIRGAEAMEVLEASAKAASSGLGETKVVADLVTSAMNAYGSENLSAANATDVLVAAVREGKAEADSLAQSMGQVLPIASELGVGFDQVGAAVAAMTRTGTDAATASTQLRQILAGLLKPAQGAEEAMRKMGTSSSGLRKVLREDGLVAVLSFLREQMEDNEQAMSQVFPNIRALSGALDIMGSNSEDNVAIFERMKDTTGALDNAFDAASQTAQFKFNQALASVKASAIEMGAILLPIAKEILEEIHALAQQFSQLDTETKKNIIRYVALGAAIGPVLIGVGSLIRMVSSLTKGVIALTGWMAKLNLSMKANVYVAVASAIALIAVQISRANRRAKEFQKTLNDALTKPASSLENLNKAIVAVKQQLKLIESGAKGTSVDPTTLDSYKRLEQQLATLVQKRDDLAKTQTWNIKPGEGVSETERILAEVDELLKSVGGDATQTQEDLGTQLSNNNDEYNRLINKLGKVTWAEMQQARAIVETNKRLQEQIDWREKMANTAISFVKVPSPFKDINRDLSDMKVNLEGIDDPMEKFRAKMKAMEDASKAAADMIANALGNAISDLATSLAKGIGEIASGSKNIKQVAVGLLNVMAGLAMQIGSLFVSLGIAVAASLNPAALIGSGGTSAIIAGGALIAAGAALKALLSGAKESNSTRVNDALIRSDGSIVEFHPDDNILAMKDFGNLQPAMSGSQVIRNIMYLDGRTVWENQKAINYRKGR